MKALLIVAMLFLSACAFVAVPHWAEREYQVLTVIATESSRGTCEIGQTETLLRHSTYLVNYTHYLPNNELIYEGAVEMDKTVQDLNLQASRGSISPIYCTMKLRVIHTMANTLAKASGGKPK